MLLQNMQQIILQLLLLHVLGRGQAQSQHWIFRPVLLNLLNVEPLEQVLPPFKITLKGRYQQRLAESARPTQKDVIADLQHLVNVCCLVHVQAILRYNLLERLNANGQLYECLGFHIVL